MTRDNAIAPVESVDDALASLDALLDDLMPEPGSRRDLGNLLRDAYEDEEVSYEDPHNRGLPDTKAALLRMFRSDVRRLARVLEDVARGEDDWDPDIMGQMVRTMMYAASYLERGTQGEWT